MSDSADNTSKNAAEVSNVPDSFAAADLRPFKGANTLKRRSVLGRGLSALMSSGPVSIHPAEPRRDFRPVTAEPEIAAPDSASIPVASSLEPVVRPSNSESSLTSSLESENLEGGMVYLALDRLVPSSVQPRQYFSEPEIISLAGSIKESGLLQPLIVRRSGSTPGVMASYEIVAGERRWRAAKTAGLRKVPVLVRQLSDKEALEFGIIENVQRADLNPIEEAQAYQRLISEFGATQDEVARTVSKDRTSIANTLRLLKLPEGLQQLMAQGQISAGHGRALLMVENLDLQLEIAGRIQSEGLSVRAAEKIVSELKKDGSGASVSVCVSSELARSANKTPDVLELEERIRRVLGTKVSLCLKKGGKGELRINFFSQVELESLLERLGA